jgi:tRNA(adenine34) deaminase
LRMELGPPWDAVFSLAWEAFVHGSTPIGAVVVDADGHIVASGRGRRLDADPSPGQLSGCRIAHAELNALARLPMAASYGDHSLYGSVEPCCLCMGAAIQTGVGRVAYAFDDPYAGAAHCMSVHNPQSARRVVTVETALGGVPGRL